MQYLRVGPKAYINPDQIVRWQFHLTSRSTELNTKDVYEITVTLWLSDGTSTNFSDLNTLEAFNRIVSEEAVGNGTFSYYMEHLIQFEKIQENL